ncbi:MAG TPA: thioesterase family protein [Kofleriaceae bacterium]|nr:thioesterase family protein [Kofleriaceae bacterium]
MNLSDVFTPRRVGDRFQLEVSPSWRQGRGAFGGLVIGAAISAIEQQVADPTRKVRSVTAQIPGPVEHGMVEIAVETLRQGKNVSTLRAALSQHGEVRTHAVAIVAADRRLDPAAPGGGAEWNELQRPVAPAWTTVAPAPVGSLWPEFAQHFEYRVIEGVPGSGGAARVLGWVRPRVPEPHRTASYIAALIDAWLPAAFMRFSAVRPMATIAFTLDIVGGVDGLDPAVPLLYRSSAPVCGAGYSLETRELWSEDGRLVAINHQTLAVIQ